MRVRDPHVVAAADAIDALRRRAPRIHAFTNLVATAFTANVLLAAGATPSMTVASREIVAFLGAADGLLINLGTLDEDRERAALTAVEAAMKRGLAWVLDPVFIERSPDRASLARTLAAARPAIIRLNGAELACLAPDSLPEAAARQLGAVLAVTGAVDLVTDGTRLVRISNGHPLMGRITASGCAAGALTAAFLPVTSDPLTAAVAALVAWGIAGEIAGERAAGPGSFVPLLIDALHGLTPDVILTHARIA